jgi:ATP-dependent DNA helicase DinG
MNPQLDVDAILGPRGALAAALPGFHHRPEQLAVARAIEAALTHRRFLLAEAGTGTGKTLAYLVPAALSGRKVVISTATRNLQEQVVHKDVPLLRDRLGLAFEVAYLKGRQNYLCLQRYEAAAAAPSFPSPDDARVWPELTRWAAHTATGDRAELEVPDDWALWRTLTATSETCLGQRCPAYESCFVTRARRQAEAADLIVVNHALFFADLALKSRGAQPQGVGVLPRYDAVVFDEAHALEEVASDGFGRQVSSFRVEELARDAEAALEDGHPMRPTLVALAASVRWQKEAFFRRAQEALGLRGEGQVRLRQGALSSLPALSSLQDALESLGAFCSGQDLPALGSVERRCAEIAFELGPLCRAESETEVYWAEARGRGLFLRAAPIEVGDDLRRRLYAAVDTVVFTSATLTAEGRFDYFAGRVGISLTDGCADAVRVESPFDYPAQVALYLPDHLPDPSAPHFAEAVAEELLALCGLTGGRAFALFTSLRNMEAAHAAAKDRLPFQVLLQGERPRSALLEAFRKEPSVLFASHSFWEGVDVPGDALSLVVIDKLPFASPSDPRVAARLDLLKSRGQDPFLAWQLPDAAIALRQGFGRLVRSRADRGVVAILDPRMHSRGYGKTFLRSLPPAHRVHSHAELRAWLAATARGT